MERIYKPHLYEGLAGDTNVNDTTTDVNDTTTDVNDTTTDVNDTTTDDNQQQPSEESSDLPETEPVPEEKDTSKKSIQEQILNTTNFNIVMLFLFLYIVAYTILGVFYKHNGSITMSFVIDIMFTVIVAGIVYVLYYSLDSKQQQE